MVHYRGEKKWTAANRLNGDGEIHWEVEKNCERTQAHAAADLGPDGELQWAIKPMERWQMETFRLRYRGDFYEQWQSVIWRQKWGRDYEDLSYLR